MKITVGKKSITIDTASTVGWKLADTPINQRVITLAIECLLSAFSTELPYDIDVVYSHEEHPKILWRGDIATNQPTTIELTVEKMSLWNQSVYQLAHEVCHMLTNYEVSKQSSNRWLEEALCESASIFVLNSLHKKCLTSDFTGLQTYAPNFKQYADNAEAKYQVENLPAYFEEYHYALRLDPIKGDSRGVRLCNRISGQLTPYLLEDESLWQECKYLSRWEDFKDGDAIEDHLTKWYQHTIDNHLGGKLPLILGKLLGLKLTI